MTDFIDDPYWGKGGRYVVDPETGKRVPVPPEPSAPGAANETPEASTAEPSTVQPIRKGK